MTDRAALLDRLADHMLVHGLAGSSLRPLARAAGTSDRMLLYYFADKAALTAAVLTVIAARMAALLAARTAPEPQAYAALKAQLLDLVLDELLWPYMRLWLEMASLAAAGDTACRTAGEAIGRGFHAWGAAQLDEPARAAELLIEIEGSVLLSALGLGDLVAAQP